MADLELLPMVLEAAEGPGPPRPSDAEMAAMLTDQAMQPIFEQHATIPLTQDDYTRRRRSIICLSMGSIQGPLPPQYLGSGRCLPSASTPMPCGPCMTGASW